MKDEPTLVAECVEAYTGFVLHEAIGIGKTYAGPTADDILSEQFPRYNINPHQTAEYHRLFSIVVEIAEAGMLSALAAQGLVPRCAREGCDNPVRQRSAKTCSKACGQEYRYNRRKQQLAHNAERRAEIRAQLGISGAEHVRQLYNAGSTVEDIHQITAIRRAEIRRTLREAGHVISDARSVA